jgi:hypothetical protein
VKGWSAAATVPAEKLEQPPVRLLGPDLARVPAGVWLIWPPDIDHTAVPVQPVTRFELFLRLRHRGSLVLPFATRD